MLTMTQVLLLKNYALRKAKYQPDSQKQQDLIEK